MMDRWWYSGLSTHAHEISTSHPQPAPRPSPPLDGRPRFEPLISNKNKGTFAESESTNFPDRPTGNHSLLAATQRVANPSTTSKISAPSSSQWPNFHLIKSPGARHSAVFLGVTR